MGKAGIGFAGTEFEGRGKARLKFGPSLLIPLMLLFPFSAGARGSIALTIANSPSNNFELAVQAIHSARRSLLINMYEFTDSGIADAIESRIRAGVHVEVLQEGKPVGGISPIGRGIESRLVEAMRASPKSDDRYWEMRSSSRGSRRFRFDHAKYMVIDGSVLWIASENFSPNGMPSPGSMGNRGWGALIQDAAIAAEFARTFQNDANPSYGDVYSILDSMALAKAETPKPLVSTFDFTEFLRPAEEGLDRVQEYLTSAPVNPAGHPVSVTAQSVEMITSPDTSEDGLVSMLRGARHSIELELMTFYVDWKDSARRSPMLEEVVSAAKRGVQVRVLLNDDAVYGSPHSGGATGGVQCDPAEEDCGGSSSYPAGIYPGVSSSRPLKNHEMVKEIEAIARREHLPLQAKIADLKAMHVALIHNKGAIIDDSRVLISSINWNENSVKRNRESAVLIESEQAANYFKPLFDRDWQVSGMPDLGSKALEFEQVTEDEASAERLAPNPSRTPDKLDCPEEMTALVTIGELERGQSFDPSFEALEGARFKVFLSSAKTHAENARECVLQEMEKENDDSPRSLGRRKRFLQLRIEEDGTFLMNLEGYTANGKLYSVRSRTQSLDWTGNHQAALYDASGARPTRLARALLELH